MNDTTKTTEISDWSKLPKEPVVSVYMLAYRHENFLAGAIEGVLAQRCGFPVELIIGEDCSPDRTRSVAIEYQRKHPSQIRIITADRNVGANANAERCRQAARGRYIAICEGDDCWTVKTKLRQQVEVMERNVGTSLICHAADKIDASRNDAKVGIERPAHVSRFLSTSEIVRGDGSLIPTCSILAHTRLVKNLRPWRRNAPVGDYPLVIQAALEGRVAYIDEVMGSYRINVPGSWTSRQTRDPYDRLSHARKIADMLHGFLSEAGEKYAGDAEEIISRYMFGAIVRNSGPRAARKSVYDAEKCRLTTFDRLVALASVISNRNLGWIRTPNRKMSSLIRRIVNDLAQPRLHRQPEIEKDDRG